MEDREKKITKLKWTMKQKVFALWAAGLVIALLGVGATIYNHFQETGRYKKINSLHYCLISQRLRLEKVSYQIISNARGFLLSGERRYLSSYKKACRSKDKVLSETEGLFDDLILEESKFSPPFTQRRLKPLLIQKVERQKLLLKEIEERFKSLILLTQREVAWRQKIKSSTLPPGELKSFELAEKEKERIASLCQKLAQGEKDLMDRETGIADWYGKQVNVALVLILFLVAFAVVFGQVFNERVIIKPISDMAAVATKIAWGDLEQEVKVERKDELGVLAQSFNQMTRHLREIINYQRAQINRILEVVDAVSQGDLTKQISIEAKDEFGKLSEALNKMGANLGGLVGQVDKATAQVTSAASEILASAEEQASGVTEQASQISQVASSLQEVTATAKQVSNSAQMVSESANRATQLAQDGGKQVADCVESVGKISRTAQATAKKIKSLGESSRQIGKIVTAISDIAEQTNMLALNAAIEAARAGEAGRGFAVVADEVRKLAERSAKSAEEIKRLIDSIQAETSSTVMAMEEGEKSVGEGVKLINATGEAFQEIISVVEQTAELSREISLSAEQQTRGNEQVGSAMSNLSQVVKQSEISARETTSAAHDLTELANELKQAAAELIVSKS